MAQRELSAWRELEHLVDERSYDEAASLALDLREVVARAGMPEAFDRGIAGIRQPRRLSDECLTDSGD